MVQEPPAAGSGATTGPGPELRADCARCFGLCCVVPAFVASADFAITKPAGHACPNLRTDSRCAIHTELRERGFPGCTVYDCFGAGQKVSQVTFRGADWRSGPDVAGPMFAAFPVMRNLHELLWYLAEALRLTERAATARAAPATLAALATDLAAAREETEAATRRDAADLLAVDVPALREVVNVLTARVSELVRSGAGPAATQRRGADLIGADLRGADLRGANLRGAYLIGTRLRGADLRSADVIGADLRGADVRGADLTDALFLTQSQVEAARGDATTTLSPWLTAPAHWATAPPPRGSRPGGRRPDRTPASPHRPSSDRRT